MERASILLAHRHKRGEDLLTSVGCRLSIQQQKLASPDSRRYPASAFLFNSRRGAGKEFGMNTFIARVAICLAVAMSCIHVWAQEKSREILPESSIKLPDFYGIYAVSDGQTVELK